MNCEYWKVSVRKLTDDNLMREAAAFTTGKECKMSLAKAYALGHSIIRTQIFWVELRNIPLFVASQLVRSHVGVQFFQRSKRPDRGAPDFVAICDDLAQHTKSLARKIDCDMDDDQVEDIREAIDELGCYFDDFKDLYDRYTPTDLAFMINAEALMNMAHKRLCSKASAETRKIMQLIVDEVREIDADLARHLVPQCVFRGGICSEVKSCGLNHTKSADDYKQIINKLNKK